MELKEFKPIELEDDPALNLYEFYWNCYQNIKAFKTLGDKMNVIPEDRKQIKDDMEEFEFYCLELCSTVEDSAFKKEEYDEDLREKSRARYMCLVNKGRY